MDHPGALRHPADGEPVPGDDRGLRPVVRREDGLGGGVTALCGERLRGRVDAGQELVHRQPRADYAGREDDDLLGPDPEPLRDTLGRRAGVLLAGQACRRVCNAGVDDHRLGLGELEVPPGDGDGRRLHPVPRPHRAADRRSERADERDVRPPGRANAGGDAGGGEAGCGGDRHQTSTPESRSPDVGARPKSSLTFWIAWPAAPLPRLSSAQITIVRSV